MGESCDRWLMIELIPRPMGKESKARCGPEIDRSVDVRHVQHRPRKPLVAHGGTLQAWKVYVILDPL